MQGAGDSFIGSLAYYLSCLPSLPLKEMIRRSSHIASLSVQREGTQTSFPERTELPQHLFNLSVSYYQLFEKRPFFYYHLRIHVSSDALGVKESCTLHGDQNQTQMF